jgi:hypothetical protein
MSILYTGSGLLTLTLDTGRDLTGASNPKILYQKPDGTKGEWTATISGQSLTYAVINTDIDQAGVWKLQTYIEVAAKKGYGEIVEQVFEKPLTSS